MAWWCPRSRAWAHPIGSLLCTGLISGLTLDSDKDQIIRLFAERGLSNPHLLDAMAADGAPVTTLRVDGGMVVNEAFCQFLCDVLDVPVQRPADVETTVRRGGRAGRYWCRLFADLAEAAALWQLGQDYAPAR